MKGAWVLWCALAPLGCGDTPPGPGPAPLPGGAPIVPARSAAQPPADGLARAFDLGLPERPWAVRFAWPAGVRVTRDHIASDGTTRKLMAVGSKGRVKLSATIQPDTAGLGSAGAVREREWAAMQMQNRYPMIETATWEDGARALVQFRVPDLRGLPVNRLERHCFLWRDGVVVHLQVSEDRHDGETVQRFDGWSASAALAARPVPPAAEAVAFGVAILGGESDQRVAKAAGLFDVAAGDLAALTPRQQVRLAVAATEAWIAADRWIDAVDLVHRLLELYPDEALLHYTRARAFGSEGKESDAVASLQRALELQAARGGAPSLPDPSEDPLFLSLTGADFTGLLVKHGFIRDPGNDERVRPGGDPGPSPGPDNQLPPSFGD